MSDEAPPSPLGQMTRRTALGALVAGGIGFAAFGPRGAKESADGRIVLDYWEKWTGHEARAMMKLVDAFNSSQKRIRVRYLTTAGIDQKALISIAAGDPPDLVGLWNYNVPQYAETGAILPLDELDTKGEVRAERFAQGFRPVLMHPDPHTKKERQWAVINTGGVLALYYNKQLFREAGLDPERPPRTIEELTAANTRLIKRSKPGSDAPLERAGFMQTEPGWWSWIWGYSFGGSLYDAGNDRCLAASPQNVAGFEWVQRTSEELGVEANKTFKAGFGNYDSPLNAFLTGKLAMVVQGPWLANVINAHGPKDASGRPSLDYGVVPMPVTADLYDANHPVGLIDCDIMVVPRGVKHPEACMEFIAFLQRQENVEAMALAHYKSSPLAVSSKAFLENHPNRGILTFDAIAKSDRTYRVPRTRAWPQIKDELDAGLQRMWSLERSAKDELAMIERRSQEYLDTVEAQRKQRGYGRA
ncbi:MAG: ABC transporter substrate-binding protein [Phycisphaerales bacterium]|nr:ABC transporter substrate-binding protein [Planctomycetota bacterium]